MIQHAAGLSYSSVRPEKPIFVFGITCNVDRRRRVQVAVRGWNHSSMAARGVGRGRRRIVLAGVAIFATESAASVAQAANAPGDLFSSGKAPGVFAGFVILALLGYSLFLFAKPLIENRDRALYRALLILLGLWILKTFVLVLFPGYRTDVATFEAWSLELASAGPARVYHPRYFLDYPPGYLYAYFWAGWFAGLIGATGGALRIIIDTPALVADLILAVVLFVFFRRRGRSLLAWVAMFSVALNPALLFDTVVWDQSDSVVTLVMFLSVVMTLEEEYELGWALAALAALVKPQGLMLVPVLGLWTVLKCDFRRWWRQALAFVAVVIVCVAPFQIGHPWSWLPELYVSGAAYYHETSVNAFNFMALVGGLRQPDSQTIVGVSYFALGMSLLLPLYAFAGSLLWRNPTPRNLMFGSFITLFGVFMFAPRMHERYLYPAVVFALPLALEEPAMALVFVLLTLGCFFNLAVVLRVLNTTTFLDSRDALAMTASMLNLFTFGLAAGYGWARSGEVETKGDMEDRLRGAFASLRERVTSGPQPQQTYAAIPWLTIDTVLLAALTFAAAAIRFWHIGHPGEIVFDEVHFVGQARHYLHGERFLDPHPPIAKLLIALGIKLFGDHPWSWRLGNATLGTIMAAVTYLLGRRMFRSRLAGALASAFILSDGMFLVDSRIGCIDIVYLTFAAIAYLMLFRFLETASSAARRRDLVYMGVSLGLCLGSKLYVPAITFLLVMGFVVFTLWRPQSQGPPADGRARNYWVAGAVLLVGSVSGFIYLAAFLPHYYLGWWGGITDLFRYYKDVMWYEKSVSTATHPYASPWWSWPLMLRPVAYWQNFPPKGAVATIWGAGNPLLWWAVIPAMAITAVRALEAPNVTRTFLVVGYLAYLVIWIPIGRILFLYHYMPSVYIGYLALAGILADFWYSRTETWETVAILLTMFPALIVGIGHAAVALEPAWLSPGLWAIAGVPFAIVIGLAYAAMIPARRVSSRFVVVVFLACAFALFIYYFPVWVGMPIARAGYYARMWFEGPGLRNWI
jgi:dolichyl-phosphate-mannose-protein mannosyltransferase